MNRFNFIIFIVAVSTGANAQGLLPVKTNMVADGRIKYNEPIHDWLCHIGWRKIAGICSRKPEVYSISDGIVSNINKIKTDKTFYIVTIKSGFYYFCYSELANTQLMKNDIIRKKNLIGVMNKEDSLYIVDFRVYEAYSSDAKKVKEIDVAAFLSKNPE